MKWPILCTLSILYIEFRSHLSMLFPKESIAKKINHNGTRTTMSVCGTENVIIGPLKKKEFLCVSFTQLPNSFRTWDEANFANTQHNNKNKNRTEMKTEKMPAWLQMNSHTKVMMLSHSVCGVYARISLLYRFINESLYWIRASNKHFNIELHTNKSHPYPRTQPFHSHMRIYIHAHGIYMHWFQCIVIYIGFHFECDWTPSFHVPNRVRNVF